MANVPLDPQQGVAAADRSSLAPVIDDCPGCGGNQKQESGNDEEEIEEEDATGDGDIEDISSNRDEDVEDVDDSDESNASDTEGHGNNSSASDADDQPSGDENIQAVEYAEEVTIRGQLENIVMRKLMKMCKNKLHFIILM